MRVPACLFGTVPPPASLDESKRLSASQSVAQVCAELKPDALVIYDVRDEPGRDGTERPYPFKPSHDPLHYSTAIKQAFKKLSSSADGSGQLDVSGSSPTDLETIVYHAACERPKEGFEKWADEAAAPPHSVRFSVLVGKPTSAATIPGFSTLFDAYQAVSQINEQRDTTLLPKLCFGGVSLPERHIKKGTEHETLLAKTKAGCQFFVTQVVYDPDAAITVIRDYEKACKDAGVKPARIFFSFAPCSRQSVMRFLRWLGVSVPAGTAHRILTAESPAAESVAVCRENWDKMLRSHRASGFTVPLGFLVESVSRSKVDAEAAVQMFRECRALLADHCSQLSQQ